MSFRPDTLITVPRGKTTNQKNEVSRPISYEIDEMDQLWVDSENFKRVNSGMDVIHPSDFLKIINTLETDVYLVSLVMTFLDHIYCLEHHQSPPRTSRVL